ncbi:hypothetical protein RIF29_30426 [Crotalaria pallida]|uniref:Uncharacterized protein n=1 Tax=Crotalaria pallida TaxID=3830 RepID=A0AAN9EG70_CROPI
MGLDGEVNNDLINKGKQLHHLTYILDKEDFGPDVAAADCNGGGTDALAVKPLCFMVESKMGGDEPTVLSMLKRDVFVLYEGPPMESREDEGLGYVKKRSQKIKKKKKRSLLPSFYRKKKLKKTKKFDREGTILFGKVVSAGEVKTVMVEIT